MEVLHLNEETFKQSLATDKVVLVDFFASWCGPCKMLAPMLEEIRKEVGEEYIIGKVDVDECFELARSFGVMSVPTLVVFKNGEEVDRNIGLKPKPAIIEMLKKHI